MRPVLRCDALVRRRSLFEFRELCFAVVSKELGLGLDRAEPPALTRVSVSF